jgi:hypothetical protein
LRKIAIIQLALLCASGLAFAANGASSSTGSKPWVDKGGLLADLGVGWGGLSVGAEYDLSRVDVAKVLPLTFGAAARAIIDPGIFDSAYASSEFGIGAFGTAHVGFKELDLPSGLAWISRLDLYAALGVGFGSATLASAYSGYSFKPGFGISTFEGISYWFNDGLAVDFEYGYVGQVGYAWPYGSFYWPLYYSTIGLILKL